MLKEIRDFKRVKNPALEKSTLRLIHKDRYLFILMLHKKVAKVPYNNLASCKEMLIFTFLGANSKGGSGRCPRSWVSGLHCGVQFAFAVLSIGAAWSVWVSGANHATVAIILTWRWPGFSKSLPLPSDPSLRKPVAWTFLFKSCFRLYLVTLVSVLSHWSPELDWEGFSTLHSYPGHPLRAGQGGHMLYKVVCVESSKDNLP